LSKNYNKNSTLASHNKRETLRPDLSKFTISAERFILLRSIAYEVGKINAGKRLNVLCKELATLEAREVTGLVVQS